MEKTFNLESEIKNFKAEQEKQKAKGLNNYNVMAAIRKIDAEVGMHSNFIYSLLDTDGDHYQVDLFAKLFIRYVLKINDFGTIKSINMEEDANGRRIDFTIKSDQYFIGIEMKIFASDQDKQIFDYYNYLEDLAEKEEIQPKVKIYYLTLNGKDASKESHQGKPYEKISFENDILKWLNESKKKVSHIQNLTNAIDYYTDIINMLIGKYKSPIKQFKEFFLNREYYEEFESNQDKVLGNFNSIEQDEILNGFYQTKQFLYDNYFKNILKELLNKYSEISFYRFDIKEGKIELNLNEYYELWIFIIDNKFTKIGLRPAWSTVSWQGNNDLKIILDEKNNSCYLNKLLEPYIIGKRKGYPLENNLTTLSLDINTLFDCYQKKVDILQDKGLYEIKQHINRILIALRKEITISIHIQSRFDDYDIFKEKMDELLSKYPNVTQCLYGRSKTEEYTNKYFKDTDIKCENPRAMYHKIQNLYKIVENSDLSIFFHRDDVKDGAMLTQKTITRATNLGKEFVVFDYDL